MGYVGTIVTQNVVDTATIADASITTAKLADNAVSTAKMFSGFSNGITEADEWRFNTNPNNITGILNSWERNDNSFEKIGTGVTNTSGVFSFPSTGKWLVNYHVYVYSNSFSRYNDIYSQVTNDNSNYYTNSYHSFPIPHSSSYMHTGGTTSAIFDVTNTTNCKIKFMVNFESPANVWVQGSTTANNTYVQFLKLGDT